MSAEKKEECADEYFSLKDSEVSQTLKAIAAARALADQTGNPETALTGMLSQALSEELKELKEKTIAESISEQTHGIEINPTQQKPTFAQRFRIFTRRQSRRSAGRLMNKAHYSTKPKR